MPALRTPFLAATLATLLAGCSTVENLLLPNETAERPETVAQRPADTTLDAVAEMEDLNDEANSLAAPLSSPAKAADYVANAIQTLESGVNFLENSYGERRGIYAGMQDNITNSAKAYLDIVSNIRAQLQVGTTPGNPQLLAQINAARLALDDLGSRVINLRELNNDIDRDLSQATFLKNMGRNAQFIQGGTESELARIQDAILRLDRTTRSMETMRDNANRLIERQQGLEQIHRNELNLLNQIVYRGVNAESFSFRPDELTSSSASSAINAPIETSMATPAVEVASLADNPAMQPAAGQAELLTLTLAGKKSGFEERLYNAVEQAHKANPDVTFTLRGVYPSGKTKADTKRNQTQAQKDADTVLSSLVDMGVPASRITVNVAPGNTNLVEVQLLQN